MWAEHKLKLTPPCLSASSTAARSRTSAGLLQGVFTGRAACFCIRMM